MYVRESLVLGLSSLALKTEGGTCQLQIGKGDEVSSPHLSEEQDSRCPRGTREAQLFRCIHGAGEMVPLVKMPEFGSQYPNKSLATWNTSVTPSAFWEK